MTLQIEQIRRIRSMRTTHSRQQIAKIERISRTTVRRYLADDFDFALHVETREQSQKKDRHKEPSAIRCPVCHQRLAERPCRLCEARRIRAVRR